MCEELERSMSGLGNKYKGPELGKGFLLLKNKKLGKTLMDFKLGSDMI